MVQIEIKELSLQYKKNNASILENANASFFSGDVVLVSGENGTGKSSLLKTMIRKEMRDKVVLGSIFFSGCDIFGLGEKELQLQRNRIAYLEQQDNFDALDCCTVEDFLYDSFEARNGKKPNNDEKNTINNLFIRYASVETKITLKNYIRNLSGGQKRFISILSDICMFNNLDFYFIDEPFNNLDMRMVRLISNLLNQIHKENSKAIFIIVSHCRILPFINKVFKIENKKLIEDTSAPICNTCFGLPDKQGFYKIN